MENVLQRWKFPKRQITLPLIRSGSEECNVIIRWRQIMQHVRTEFENKPNLFLSFPFFVSREVTKVWSTSTSECFVDVILFVIIARSAHGLNFQVQCMHAHAHPHTNKARGKNYQICWFNTVIVRSCDSRAATLAVVLFCLQRSVWNLYSWLITHRVLTL